jgi:AraC family transcriptional regulator, regulatory protein of adaptative response / DNA-3-methyladenine glycosylase II
MSETQPISPETLAGADLSGVGLTGARQQAVQAFSRAVADGSVRPDRSVGIDDLVSSITALPGLGP